MKKLILMMIVAAAHTVLAQDIFQQKLYSPDLVIKYSEEAGLSAEQLAKVKSAYNGQLTAYNEKKWELDAAMAKLEQLISQSTVDAKAADAQLEKSLALETDIKKMKLALLLKVKNILTPGQQAALDKHKDEPVAENSIIAPLGDDQRTVVRIRSNVNHPAKPLYIIEGKEHREGTDIPADVKPEDIESLEVLKGRTAADIYGKRGENGVIIIKLKNKKKQ